MTQAFLKNIAAYVDQQQALEPSASVAGAITGGAIDTFNSGNKYTSGVLYVRAGTPTGTPTSYTVTGKLQHSTASTTGWADVTGGAIATISGTSAAAGASIGVDLAPLNRYVRFTGTIAITGGTTPTVPTSAEIVFAGQSVPI